MKQNRSETDRAGFFYTEKYKLITLLSETDNTGQGFIHAIDTGYFTEVVPKIWNTAWFSGKYFEQYIDGCGPEADKKSAIYTRFLMAVGIHISVLPVRGRRSVWSVVISVDDSLYETFVPSSCVYLGDYRVQDTGGYHEVYAMAQYNAFNILHHILLETPVNSVPERKRIINNRINAFKPYNPESRKASSQELPEGGNLKSITVRSGDAEMSFSDLDCNNKVRVVFKEEAGEKEPVRVDMFLGLGDLKFIESHIGYIWKKLNPERDAVSIKQKFHELFDTNELYSIHRSLRSRDESCDGAKSRIKSLIDKTLDGIVSDPDPVNIPPVDGLTFENYAKVRGIKSGHIGHLQGQYSALFDDMAEMMLKLDTPENRSYTLGFESIIKRIKDMRETPWCAAWVNAMKQDKASQAESSESGRTCIVCVSPMEAGCVPPTCSEECGNKALGVTKDHKRDTSLQFSDLTVNLNDIPFVTDVWIGYEGGDVIIHLGCNNGEEQKVIDSLPKRISNVFSIHRSDEHVFLQTKLNIRRTNILSSTINTLEDLVNKHKEGEISLGRSTHKKFKSIIKAAKEVDNV